MYPTLSCLILWISMISIGLSLELINRQRQPRVQTDEEKLLELLFKDSGYNPSARPVLNSSKTVAVSVQLSLLQIQELNLKSQVFTTTGLLILEWRDERLRWDLEEFPMRDIVVEARKLWRPEFASIKGAEDIYKEFGQFRAVIEHDGKVHWEPGGVFKTICEIDITYYPFDEQCCTIMFGAWSYHTLKMNLTNVEDSVNLDSFEENGEWEVYKTRAVRSEMNTSSSQEKLSNVEFQIFIRRRYTFYILNVILPSLMTSVILLSVFFSTPAQKVQIGVVVLLSFRILLLNVTDSIPKTSEHIPLLGVYLTLTMGITTLSMVLTVYVLNLYAVSDRPVPRWADTLVTVYLARLVGMHGKHFSHDHDGSTSDLIPRGSDYIRRQKSYNDSSGANVGSGGSTERGKRGFNDARCATNPCPGHMRLNSVELIRLRETLWSKEWKRVAEIVDRLFFWVFLTAIAASTLYLLHPIVQQATYKPKRSQ